MNASSEIFRISEIIFFIKGGTLRKLQQGNTLPKNTPFETQVIKFWS